MLVLGGLARGLNVRRRKNFPLERPLLLPHIVPRQGPWTVDYEPRQGRKAATVVCSAFAVVTLALFKFGMGVQSAE